MKFLSARDFHPLAFLGLLLAMATALPTSQVRRGDFTEDTIYTTSQQVGGLITYILREIFEMRKELCTSDPDCMANDDALSENNLELPVIQRNDGCFQTGYNREICLLKITSGLLDYQIYLEFVKNNVQDNKKDKARVLQSTTKTLNQIFKQEVKDPGKIVIPSPSSKALLMEKLESQKEWSRTKTIQLILKALEEFLKDTMRSTRQN
ncbi:interleukin-6 [Peromyscus californicus insignis]|uniref:interleukin-6 n=1 Tax=Peromyscus californicus insignis TaxID=564181 RepID=UPI0022A7F247|nr:interleukin-6 [Peromyscus californicus insignis]